MKQYISKSDLVAEIEEWRDGIKKCIFSIPLTGSDRADATFEYEILGKVRDSLNTLEVKEVDLKKEVCKYVQKHFTIDKEQLDRFGIKEKDYMYSMDKSDILLIAKHFFELGLKAKGK